MRAIVLAAGAGQRMRPLTDDRHKSLLEVDGTSILERIIEGLHGIEVSDILVVTGYRHEEVEDFLKNKFGHAPIRCLQNARFRETNNIVSLAMALEHLELDQDLILIECDVLFNPALLRLLAGEQRGNLALVDHYRPGMDGTVVSVSDGVVTEVYPPHLQGEDFDYRDKFKTVNIYRFDGEFCRTTFRPLLSVYAHQIDGASYYELVLGMLIHTRRQPVRAVLVESSQWAEVDDPNDLASARYVFETGQRSQILAETMGAYWNFDVLDFSFLRNMYFPTDAMLAAMRRALPSLVRNYGSAQTVLDQKLGYALACRADRLLCLNGGAQAFPWLQTAYADARVLHPRVTFNEYARWLPHGDSYAHLPAEVGNYDLVVVVNPNNPTGATVPTRQVHALAAANPATQFLVDESFVAFSGQPSLLSQLEAAPLDNVLVLASLSKTWGIPGVRLGYLYSTNRAWLQRFRAQMPIWNANSLAEFFLEMVLKFQPELAASFVQTAADRAAMAQELAKVPIVAEVFPSGADFLMVRLTRSVAEVVEVLLRRHSIYIKDLSGKFPASGQYARLAVRTPADNQRLVDALTIL